MKRKPPIDPRIVEKAKELVAQHFNITPAQISTGEDKNARMAGKVLMYGLRFTLGASLRDAKEAAGQKWDPAVYATRGSIGPLVEEGTLYPLMQLFREVAASYGWVLPVNAPVADAQMPTRRKIYSSKPPSTLSTASDMVSRARKAVASVFLGEALLEKKTSGTELNTAHDAVIYIVWRDLPYEADPLLVQDVQKKLDILEGDMYQSIGRIYSAMRNKDGVLKRKLWTAWREYTVNK